MFQHHKDNQTPVTAHGFMISVDVEEGAQPIEYLTDRLAAALTFVEGVGNVAVDYIGKLDVMPEEPK